MFTMLKSPDGEWHLVIREPCPSHPEEESGDLISEDCRANPSSPMVPWALPPTPAHSPCLGFVRVALAWTKKGP